MVKDGIRARQLWQVPTFLLGLTALTVYLLVRPAWANPLVRAEARLDRARRLWQKQDPHVRKVVTLLEEYLDRAGPKPARAAEAHFLWGSTLARSARKADGSDTSGLWKQAWEHLTQASELRLEEADRPALRALLGETGFHVGFNPAQVKRWLMLNLDHADDRAEACRVLTLACLKKAPPDLKAALYANELLRQLPLIGEDVLGPARLQGGEILLRMSRSAEARKLLEKISKEAPPDLLARSRAMRAQSLQLENQWGEAAALWQEMIDDRRRPLEDSGLVYHNLALCHRRLDHRDEAILAWREALARGNAEVAAASALGLVELVVPREGVQLLDLLARSVRGIRSPGDWKNPYTDLKQARDLFEQACQFLRQNREYARALDAADCYEKLAIPGRAAFLRGLALREWSRASLQEPEADPARAANLMRQAGVAFQISAESAAEKAEAAERLWLSSEGHFEGGEAARTVEVLEQFLKVEGHPVERSGEAWYRLARAQELLAHEPAAEAAYKRAISYRSRFACRAQFRRSQMELARGHIDSAAGMLAQNLQSLRLDHDDEALENTLYTLAHLLFSRQDKDPVVLRPLLEEAIAKYPASPMRVRGRLELAETYRLLASQQNQNVVSGSNLKPDARDFFLKQRRHWLLKAAEQYQALTQILAADPAVGKTLTRTEQIHVSFSVADCRFNLGEYPVALQLYDDLAERYRNRLERLIALGGTARCFAAQRDFSKFRSRLQDIRVALEDVDDQTRRQWEEWLTIAGKGQ